MRRVQRVRLFYALACTVFGIVSSRNVWGGMLPVSMAANRINTMISGLCTCSAETNATRSRAVGDCYPLQGHSGPYLLKDVFDDLLYGHPAPQDTKIWEISRFAIQPSQKNYRSLAAVHEITGRMFERLFEFGLEHGIVRIVGVTDVLCERLLARTGVFIERFGPPKKIGRTLAVAGWLDVSRENLDRVRAYCESQPPGPEAAHSNDPAPPNRHQRVCAGAAGGAGRGRPLHLRTGEVAAL